MRQYLAIEQARFSDRLRAAVRDRCGPRLRPRFPASRCSTWSRTRSATALPSARTPARVTIRARRAGDALELSVQDDGAGIDERGRAAAEGTASTTRASGCARSTATSASLRVEPARPQAPWRILRMPYRELDRGAGAVRRAEWARADRRRRAGGAARRAAAARGVSGVRRRRRMPRRRGGARGARRARGPTSSFSTSRCRASTASR